jgi:hypothetical protein
MPAHAHALHHLHTAVYETTGWALPDVGLRQLVQALPQDLWAQAAQPSEAPSPALERWCRNERATVHAVVNQLQAAAAF